MRSTPIIQNAQHANQIARSTSIKTRAARQSKRVQHAVECASSTPIKTRTARQSNCTQHTNKIVRSTQFKTYAVHESKRAQQSKRAQHTNQIARSVSYFVHTSIYRPKQLKTPTKNTVPNKCRGTALITHPMTCPILVGVLAPR